MQSDEEHRPDDIAGDARPADLAEVRARVRAEADRTLCVDVDDTICFTDRFTYGESRPNDEVIRKLREAHTAGWRIVLHTARGQGRSGGRIELVAEEVIAEVAAFCARNDVPYDEILVGKPYARWYVDDKALRPEEFASMDLGAPGER